MWLILTLIFTIISWGRHSFQSFQAVNVNKWIEKKKEKKWWRATHQRRAPAIKPWPEWVEWAPANSSGCCCLVWPGRRRRSTCSERAGPAEWAGPPPKPRSEPEAPDTSDRDWRYPVRHRHPDLDRYRYLVPHPVRPIHSTCVHPLAGSAHAVVTSAARTCWIILKIIRQD